MEFDAELDASGLRCPLPILRTKKALAALESGQLLRVRPTDPGPPHERAVFSRQPGHALLLQQTEGDTTVHWLRRR